MKLAIGGVPDRTGPLEGIRVIDLSTVVSGPLCGQLLGDMGAEVIKVEALSGDTTRRLGPPFKAGFTGLYTQVNRNKRGIAVDLKTEQGQDVVRRLARDADVLIENYRPGVAERLGIGYEALAAENPRLVYVAISGFGPEGPYRDLPAYDTVIQGLAGFMPIQGKGGEPTLVKSIAADKTASLTATYAVLAALFARERSDRGQRVDVPMLDSYVAFMLGDVFAAEAFHPKEPMQEIDVHRTWETEDGHVVIMVIEDHQFQGMCRAVDREDLIDDPRCANIITRIQNIDSLFDELAQEIRKWPTEVLVERARRFGAPVAPANGIDEMMEDPQVRHSGIVLEADHPDAGTMRFLRNPVRFDSTPTSMRRLPPALGEQTDEILAEVGFGEEEIAALRKRGAVA